MSDIEVVRGNDLYFPRGNEKGDYYEITDGVPQH